MKSRFRFSWLLWFVLAGSTPAYANNPAAPDSMLSLLMIFPVVILALRWAGAKLPQQARKWRVAKWFGLGLAFLLCAAGTGISLIGLLVLICYGLWRGSQVIQFGQGRKRFAIGGGVMLFTLLAIANYGQDTGNPLLMRENSARYLVRDIVTAERTFQASGLLDVNKNGISEYGTLEQLVQADRADYLRAAERNVGKNKPIFDTWRSPFSMSGYQFIIVLSGDPARDEKQFFVYATPTNYGEYPWWSNITLLRRLAPTPPRYAKRTFASDETGVVRERDLGGSRPVTREEAQKWALLGP